MKRLVLLSVVAVAVGVPAGTALARGCDDLPVNAACEGPDGYCDVYKKPHPRLGAGLCLRVTP